MIIPSSLLQGYCGVPPPCLPGQGWGRIGGGEKISVHPSHEGRGSLIIDTLQLAVGWFIGYINYLSRKKEQITDKQYQMKKTLEDLRKLVVNY